MEKHTCAVADRFPFGGVADIPLFGANFTADLYRLAHLEAPSRNTAEILNITAQRFKSIDLEI